MGISTIKQPIDWSKLNIFSEFPELVAKYGEDAANYILSGGASDLYTRMNVGFDVTEEDILRHRMNKSMNYDGGLKGYKHINTNSIPVSDATDGYHIRSGIDFANLATGNLPGGGIPAALSGIGYQQLAGLFDGTVGKNAFLQSVDNIRGLRESGKAPALDALYNFGGGVHNLFNNPSSIDVTALGGPRAKGNIFNSNMQVNPTVRPTVQPQGPAGFTQPTVQPVTQPITQPITQPTVQPRVNNVSPGGGNSRRGTPSYAQQAAAVNRKSASMGVKSPIRKSGNRYGFGL